MINIHKYKCMYISILSILIIIFIYNYLDAFIIIVTSIINKWVAVKPNQVKYKIL